MRQLRRVPRREGLTRPRWRAWTAGVVLKNRFKWGPSVPGLKLTFLAPHRAEFRREVPGLGPFRQSGHLFRRRREFRRLRRRRLKYRVLHLGGRLLPPLFPPRMGGLPPRGYRQHFNFWSPRRGTRRRGLSFHPNRRGDPRRARRRRRRAYRGHPGGVAHSFREDYLRGLSGLFSSSLSSSGVHPGTPRNRLNLTVRAGRFGTPSYLVPPRRGVATPRRGGTITHFNYPQGWPTPRVRVRPRRVRLPRVTPPAPGMENLLEGTAHLVRARYGYRRGRATRVARRRRRAQLVTRDERRGWIFRRPRRGARQQETFELPAQLARKINFRRNQRRSLRKGLTFRKRCRTNRVRQLRRRRKLRVPRRVWKLFRRISRRARRRWTYRRVGPHGTNRTAGGGFYRMLPYFRPPWWRPRRFRPRLSTPRRIQLGQLRRRRYRQVFRTSWVGVRGVIRRGRPRRGYLRFRAGLARPRRGRGRRSRSSGRGTLKLRNRRVGPTRGVGDHLGRWFGLFTRGGITFPQGGREILRATPRGGILGLYQLFHTSLGSRSRRRGGALLKVPTLLQPTQSWSQVRRWFTRGVATRGDRGWLARITHEVATPTGTARGREEFIRAALFNRALL